jgi:hypothetical protein
MRALQTRCADPAPHTGPVHCILHRVANTPKSKPHARWVHLYTSSATCHAEEHAQISKGYLLPEVSIA